jgi:hypothetical protein
MLLRSRIGGRAGLAVLCAVVLVALPSCNKAVKRVPVSGTVTLDGKPLGVGVVSFAPDNEKGNTHRIACIGRANSGKYDLTTAAMQNHDNGPGAPVGWYKVYLDTTVPGAEDLKIHAKFKDLNKTPISIEVVESPAPGAYDIQFTSK